MSLCAFFASASLCFVRFLPVSRSCQTNAERPRADAKLQQRNETTKLRRRNILNPFELVKFPDQPLSPDTSELRRNEMLIVRS